MNKTNKQKFSEFTTSELISFMENLSKGKTVMCDYCIYHTGDTCLPIAKTIEEQNEMCSQGVRKYLESDCSGRFECRMCVHNSYCKAHDLEEKGCNAYKKREEVSDIAMRTFAKHMLNKAYGMYAALPESCNAYKKREAEEKYATIALQGDFSIETTNWLASKISNATKISDSLLFFRYNSEETQKVFDELLVLLRKCPFPFSLTAVKHDGFSVHAIKEYFGEGNLVIHQPVIYCNKFGETLC